MDPHRAKIGKQSEALAQRQQALLRADLLPRVIPFRSADSAEQHRVTFLGLLECRRPERRTEPVDRSTASDIVGQIEFTPRTLLDGLEDLDRLAHDLATDSIAGQD